MPCTGHRVAFVAALCVLVTGFAVVAGPLVPPAREGPSQSDMTSQVWDVFITINTNGDLSLFPFPDFDRAIRPEAASPGSWSPAIRLTTVYRKTDTYRRGGEEFWDQTPGIELVDPGPPDVFALMNTNPFPARPKKPSSPKPEEDIWADDVVSRDWTSWLPGAGGISMLFCLAVLIIVAFKAR